MKSVALAITTVASLTAFAQTPVPVDVAGKAYSSELGGQKAGCPENLTLEITLDDLGSQTTWVLLDNTGLNIVASGGPYADGQAGTVIVENLCLLSDCYALAVMDDGSDGIQGGGYVLKDDQGRRIIDADGQFGNTSQIANTQQFCLPLSNQGLITPWCDNTTLGFLPNTQIYATAQPGAKGYQFWIFDPHGSYSRKVYVPTQNLHPTFLQTNPVPANIDLNVRVRAAINGNLTNWGKACVIRMNSAAPLSPRSAPQLMDEAREIMIVPNPSTGSNTRIDLVGMGWSDEALTIEVVDAMGRVLHQERQQAGASAQLRSTFIDQQLSPGVYFARVLQADQQIVTRFVVER